MKNNKLMAMLLSLSVLLILSAGGYYLYSEYNTKQVETAQAEVKPTEETTEDINDIDQPDDESLKTESQKAEKTKKELKSQGFDILEEEAGKIVISRDNKKYVVDDNNSIIPYEDAFKTPEEYAKDEEDVGDEGNDLAYLKESAFCLSKMTNPEDLIDLGIPFEDLENINASLSLYAQADLGLKESFETTYVNGSINYISEDVARFNLKLNNEYYITAMFSFSSRKVTFKLAD